MLSANPFERRLQFSGILLILGLFVEAVCLFWTRPIAFVLFLCVGGLLLALGILLFLFSLVGSHTPPAS
jgi:hypothetical protein